MPMKRRTLALAAVGVAGAAAGLVWRSRQDGVSADHAGGSGSPPTGSGDPALSSFWAQSVERVDGRPLALGSLRGRRLLVNFWATWCPPCIREMPLLDRFHREFGTGAGPRRWTVLGLAIDRREAVVDFLARQPVGYEIALAGFEGSQWSRQMGNDTGGLPFSVAIDASGRIVERKLGEVSEAELRSWASR